MPSESETAFVLPEKLTIVNAEHIHQALEEHLKEGVLLELEGQSVQQVDTAGLQILVSLKRTLQTEGTTLILNEASEPLKAAIEQSGLSGEFDL